MIKIYSLKKDGELSLSKNFKVKEFRCKDGSDTIKIDTELVTMLQKIRDIVGVPVKINSAYRTPSYNAKVGGAKNSYHTKGQACDIVCSGKTPLDIAKIAESLGMRGIIKYNTFTHVDTRPTKYYSINKNGAVTKCTTFNNK